MKAHGRTQPKYDFLAEFLREFPDQWWALPPEFSTRQALLGALNRRLEGCVRIAQRRAGGRIYVRHVTRYEPDVPSPFAARGQYAQRVLAL